MPKNILLNLSITLSGPLTGRAVFFLQRENFSAPPTYFKM
jgi:hypothetical protein